jgi:hypothetical protein
VTEKLEEYQTIKEWKSVGLSTQANKPWEKLLRSIRPIRKAIGRRYSYKLPTWINKVPRVRQMGYYGNMI